MKNKILSVAAIAVLTLSITGCYSKEDLNVSSAANIEESKLLEVNLVSGLDVIYTENIIGLPVVIELKDKRCNALGVLTYENYKTSILLTNVKCKDSEKYDVQGFFFDKNKNIGPIFSIEKDKFIVKPQNGFIYIDQQGKK
ncbi:hypothetical protein ACNSOL_11690 (plasmid) [Aliarcobacter lanthieri]|uniref:hypothetical protein n=1 Tax=Aliarcobacter lanthieri TaxID=1355374 RepID=UPI003AAC552A